MTLRAVDGDGLPNRMMSAKAGVGAMASYHPVPKRNNASAVGGASSSCWRDLACWGGV